MKLKNQEVKEESNVRLHCELSEAGVPVQWRKGEEVLASGLKHHITHIGTSVELTMVRALPEDSGVYSCICANQNTKATITVVGRLRSSQAFVLM